MQQFLEGTPLGEAWRYLASSPSQPQHRRQGSDEQHITAANCEKNLATSQVFSVDDPLNKDKDPKQWPLTKKLRVVVIISFYTFTVYAGSAIYIASVDGVMHEYGTSTQKALLGLSLYVLGCK